ncbi:MAG: hypothetical protein WCT47_03575 [Betaproteobacteria bacterium]
MGTVRTPPPAAVDLGPEPIWRAFAAVLWTLAVGTVASWLVQRLGIGGAPSAWAAVLGLALAASFGVWRRGAALVLRLEWTGREWRLRPWLQAPPDALPAQSAHCAALLGAARPCAPMVMIDLGSWMLLRLDPQRGAASPDWVAVSQRLVGSSWHGLRVALYCAPTGLPDPAATPATPA